MWDKLTSNLVANANALLHAVLQEKADTRRDTTHGTLDTHRKAKKKPNGTAPIYLIVRVGSKEKLIFSGKYIEPDLFDNKTETCKHKKLHLVLHQEKNKLTEIILDLEREGKLVSHEAVSARYSLATMKAF
ncbi:MAG: hypothetical protein HC831_28870 [Chloroflexia bacterium]|nr:hypothetical protein [Chloroflexia bacterium]